MPLLQESTPKRELLTVRESSLKVANEPDSAIAYPAFPNPAMFTPSQILMASQLMAASRLTLPNNSAFFHPGLLPLAWQANSPPSPPHSEQGQLSPPMKGRHHNNNNNNNVVSSTNGGDVGKVATVRKSRMVGNKWPSAKSNKELISDSASPCLSSPTSSVSPPDSLLKESSGTTGTGNRDRPFTCEVCNRSFGYKHVLQNHERTHTGEKPFECQQCHKRFTRDHHLKTHIRLHTGERPYHCEHCDRQFVQVANLRRHLRVHTGERPYSCDRDRCNAKFSDSNQLKSHLLIHTNEKPFECDRCHGSFRRRHHLLHHKCGNLAAEISSEIASEEEDRRTTPTLLHPPSIPLVTLPLRVALPEQTEPEDLSMSTGLHSHSSGDSPMSRSPNSPDDDVEEMDEQESADIFLRRKHHLQ